jgi:hypothetical protein
MSRESDERRAISLPRMQTPMNIVGICADQRGL